MEIKMINPRVCPTLILLPSHYRDDGTCRCDETICEYDNCVEEKFNGEIYCKTHLGDLYEWE